MNAETHIHVFDKATAELVETLVSDSAESVVAAAAQARAAQPAWAALSPKERGNIIKRARRELIKDKTKIRDALARETGKTSFEVIGELFSVCQDIGHYAGKATKWLKPRKTGTYPLFGKKGMITYKPFGVVGVITPWNAPLALALGDALPALFAGNTVLLKPSEITPLAVKYAIEAFNRVLPEGVLQCLIGEGAVGSILVEQVDMVTMTGSCATGKRVMQKASEKLTPVLLELGGKDPMIVLNDANVERASNAAVWGSCFMTGQVCMSVERIYVESGIAPEFKRLVQEKIQAIKTGPELAVDERDYGPFIGPAQVKIVEDHVASASQQGATIAHGGHRLQNEKSGVFFEPTLITDVDHSMRIMHEETFGPVVCVMEVGNVEEAIRLANDSVYGLNASIWTKNIKKGIELAQRLESGNVCINDCIFNAGVHSLPFGGTKQSGVGSRHGGPDGLRAFCHTQSLMIEPRNKPKEMAWFPDNKKITQRLDRLMTFLYR